MFSGFTGRSHLINNVPGSHSESLRSLRKTFARSSRILLYGKLCDRYSNNLGNKL